MVKIIVDSTADLKEHVKERVQVVPLTVHFGEEEYIDGVSITHKEFYEKLVESDVLPHTSQPNPADFGKVFRETVDAGDTAVVLCVSASLSGTCQSANIAAADFPGRIFVVDTESVAIGLGILAERALQLADEGFSACEIARQINSEKKDICLVALVDTLEYLMRGGRLSKTASLVGGILSIKPVISLRDGEIVVLGKARGSRQGNNFLIQEIEKSGGIDFERPMLLGYTGLSDNLLKKYMADSAALWEGNIDTLPYTLIGSVIGTHAGPGAIAVAFFKK